MPELETIFVALLDEDVDVWRPVLAERRAHGAYLIASRNTPPDEEVWEFLPGSLVRCERRELSERACLVAVAPWP